MKRERLKELGLNDEQINEVMSEHGKSVEKHKTLSDNAKTELEGVKTQLKEANTQIQGFKDMDIESIKKSADDWETKYETDTKALKEQINQKEYNFNLEKYIAQHEFVSDFTKNAFIEEFKKKEFKIEDGKFLGADDFIKTFKESNAGVFKEADNTQQQNNTYNYKPSDGNSSKNTESLGTMLAKEAKKTSTKEYDYFGGNK